MAHLGRGEGVHEQEREFGAELLALVLDLLGNNVQERLAILHNEQRLGLLQTHRCPKAAVELEHGRLAKERLDLLLQGAVGAVSDTPTVVSRPLPAQGATDRP